MTFVLKRIIGCNPLMTVFITHGHCIVWRESVKNRVWESVKTWVWWESVKTQAWCMSGSHLISLHDMSNSNIGVHILIGVII